MEVHMYLKKLRGEVFIYFFSVKLVVFPFSWRRSPRTSAERIFSRGTGRCASKFFFFIFRKK